MKKNLIFLLSIVGILAGIGAAVYFGQERSAQPPLFEPVSSPYAKAIYSNGIIESLQPGGSNINVYAEVPGPLVKVMVHEGQTVSAGQPLVAIDDSVQRATVEQIKAQAQAAFSLLNGLKAQPRPETLAVAKAQLELAQANLKTAQDAFDKRQASWALDPHAISRDALDQASDAALQARSAVDVARRQYELTQAGAWVYDIRNQESLYQSLQQSYLAANALLAKYVIRAQRDGVVLALNAAPGSFVSTQGTFDAYTQGQAPVLILSSPQDELAVRCYVDEILVSRLPTPEHIKAQMQIRGTERKVTLEFVRVQPYVSPKLELSNQRQEKVDLRVLPVIFKFAKKDVPAVYPGQLVDVYIGEK